MTCLHGKSPTNKFWEKVLVSGNDYDGFEVVYWCRECGAIQVVFYEDFYGTYPTNKFYKMQIPKKELS